MKSFFLVFSLLLTTLPAFAYDHVTVNVNGRTYTCSEGGHAPGPIPPTGTCYRNNGSWGGDGSCDSEPVGAMCNAGGRRGICLKDHMSGSDIICKCLPNHGPGR